MPTAKHHRADDDLPARTFYATARIRPCDLRPGDRALLTNQWREVRHVWTDDTVDLADGTRAYSDVHPQRTKEYRQLARHLGHATAAYCGVSYLIERPGIAEGTCALVMLRAAELVTVQVPSPAPCAALSVPAEPVPAGGHDVRWGMRLRTGAWVRGLTSAEVDDATEQAAELGGNYTITRIRRFDLGPEFLTAPQWTAVRAA